MSFRFLGFPQPADDQSQRRPRRLQFEALENRRVLAADITDWPDDDSSTDETPAAGNNSNDTPAVADSTQPAEFAVVDCNLATTGTTAADSAVSDSVTTNTSETDSAATDSSQPVTEGSGTATDASRNAVELTDPADSVAPSDDSGTDGEPAVTPVIIADSEPATDAADPVVTPLDDSDATVTTEDTD